MPNRYESYKVNAKEYYENRNINIRRVKLPKHQSGIFDQIICFLYYAKFVLLKVRNEKYNIVFASSSRLMTAYLGALISKKFKIPLYLDIRDLFFDSISNIYKDKVPKFLLHIIRLIEKWTFQQATIINLVSEGFIEDVQKISKKIRYRVFTNGIDNIFLEKDFKNSTLNTYPLNILYAGNIGEGQGLDKIIPGIAMGLGDKAFFKVIGSGGAKPKLEEQLLQNNIKNVKLIEPVSRDDLFSHYREAHILFLHLNDFDAFKKVLPSKFFEYVATGKHILAGVNGYAYKFFNDSIDGVMTFKPCDVQGALNSINKFDFDEKISRSGFCKKYLRSSIMNRMADDIIKCCND